MLCPLAGGERFPRSKEMGLAKIQAQRACACSRTGTPRVGRACRDRRVPAPARFLAGAGASLRVSESAGRRGLVRFGREHVRAAAERMIAFLPSTSWECVSRSRDRRPTSTATDHRTAFSWSRSAGGSSELGCGADERPSVAEAGRIELKMAERCEALPSGRRIIGCGMRAERRDVRRGIPRE